MGAIDRQQVFVRLGEYFLLSHNPRLDREVIVLECLHSYDQPIPENRPIRHTAHDFIRACDRIIEKDLPASKNRSNPLVADMEQWIQDWNEKLGINS